MNKETFIKEVEKLGIEVTEEKLIQLEDYYQLLYLENQKYNLTAITEKESVYLKHFYDSLTIVKSLKLDNQYVLDIGTGAGFPGIVLKIFFPNLKIDLLDATTKKCQFLNLVINKLNLKNIKTINSRAEVYSKTHRELYDLVVSRAVAPLKHLLEYSIPTLKVHGHFVALKSNITEEIKDIQNYYQKLSLTNELITQFKLPLELSDRTIYQIEKISPTKSIYPRPYSQIKKKSL